MYFFTGKIHVRGRVVGAVLYQVVEARDMALDELYGGEPWWMPLHPSNNPFNFRFQMSDAGMIITRSLLWFFEKIW